MVTKYLRKIILEELRKVLKEVEYTPEQRKKLEDEAEKDKRAAESGEDLRQQRLKAFGDEEGVYSQAPEKSADQLEYSDESKVLPQLKTRRSGIVCDFALMIQSLIRNKIKFTRPELVGRVSDGRMGFVTSGIINFVIDYGNKNKLDTQGLVKIPLTERGYKNACFGTTAQQKQKLKELFSKIPVKAIETAAEEIVQEKPINIFDYKPTYPPTQLSASRQKEQPKETPPAREMSRTRSSTLNVGDVMTMDGMPYNIGVWDGKDFIPIGDAKEKGIKIKTTSLSQNQLAALKKDFPDILREEILKKEILKLLKKI